MVKNHKAVVTGGTKGIGRAIVNMLASQGFDVAVCARTQDDLINLRNELDSHHVEIVTHVADVSKKEDIDMFAQFIRSKWNAIDILVNNAGVFEPGSVLTEEKGQLERMMETNLYSAYYLTRALIPLIGQGTKPHIFNLCSIASKIAYPNGGSYSISKFALLGYTKVLREELKSQNIRVTAVLPGATWSDSWAGADLPEDRLMQANDIATLVWSSYSLSASADVEEIVVRPQLGDL